MASSYTSGELIDRARADTGLHEFGSGHFEVFLDALCVDLGSGMLSEFGRDFLARLAVRNLKSRLRFMDALRANPEVRHVPIPRMVRIMGFPRSGTTLLHNLLAGVGVGRSLLRWELIEPLPPPEAATYATDPRIARVQASLEPLRGRGLEAMHWVDAADPEECPWGFLDLTGLLGRGAMSVLPAWSEAVCWEGRRHRETYEEYRWLIQLLLWRNPMPDGRILVLKSPADTARLETFAEVFPETSFVLAHRDPYRCLTSVVRVGEIITDPFLEPGCAAARTERGVRMCRRMLGDQAGAMVAAAQAMPDRLRSIDYAALMADPGTVVSEVLESLSVPCDADLARRGIAEFLAAQRAGKREKPPAQYDDYGLSHERVLAGSEFATYVETFGVSVEGERVTDPVS